jgi:hypothetical protein
MNASRSTQTAEASGDLIDQEAIKIGAISMSTNRSFAPIQISAPGSFAVSAAPIDDLQIHHVQTASRNQNRCRGPIQILDPMNPEGCCDRQERQGHAPDKIKVMMVMHRLTPERSHQRYELGQAQTAANHLPDEVRHVGTDQVGHGRTGDHEWR